MLDRQSHSRVRERFAALLLLATGACWGLGASLDTLGTERASLSKARRRPPAGEASKPHAGAAPQQIRPFARPILITVDDLPIAAGSLHTDPAERARITAEMLAVLKKHQIHAVGFVTGERMRGEGEAKLLDLWLADGHELGNHSYSHLSYTSTATETYIADVERERVWLANFLAARAIRLRFFRFPFLREGNTPEKLRAMREYLGSTEQVSLPVTIDNQDWSFEEPWVTARRTGDWMALKTVTEDYQAAMRLHVRHHEERSARLHGRATPEILLLHAGEVGSAQWGALFTWLEKTGHRFAGADEVLSDPAFKEPCDELTEYGYGRWDCELAARRKAETAAAIKKTLDTQAAAWNRGDLERFTSVYAEDASFASPSGITRGRQAVLERYRKKYPGHEAMGTLTLEIVETRLAAGEEISLFGDAVPGRVQGATVLASWRLEFPGKPAASGHTLLVLRPRGDGWEIVQDASWSGDAALRIDP